MRTEHTYIFTIVRPGDADEIKDTRACGDALFSKYSRKSCHYIEIALKDPYNTLKTFDGTTTNATIIKWTPGPPIGVGDVGVYIVGNFYPSSGLIETLEASALAEMLKFYEFKSIRKLCLIACSAAKEPKEAIKGESFLHKFCRELAKEPQSLTPMIAGWDVYVEVMTPTASGIIRYVNKEKKEPYPAAEANAHIGAKIFATTSNKTALMAKDPTGSAHKKVLQWDGSKLEPVLVASGWSDRLT